MGEIIIMSAAEIITGVVQPMPDLGEEDRRALAGSIAAHGVQVPVEVARLPGHDRLVAVDGNNRAEMARKIAVSVPVRVLEDITTLEQAVDYALRANCARRQLDAAGKRAAIRGELERNAARSDRLIAELCGCDHMTVLRVRRALRREQEAATGSGEPVADSDGGQGAPAPAPAPESPAVPEEPERREGRDRRKRRAPVVTQGSGSPQEASTAIPAQPARLMRIRWPGWRRWPPRCPR